MNKDIKHDNIVNWNTKFNLANDAVNCCCSWHETIHSSINNITIIQPLHQLNARPYRVNPCPRVDNDTKFWKKNFFLTNSFSNIVSFCIVQSHPEIMIKYLLQSVYSFFFWRNIRLRDKFYNKTNKRWSKLGVPKI